MKNSLFFLLFLSLIVGLAFQGSRGLFESTEGRYAESAREMMETGNYLEPQLNYKPHWTKPPFIYWALVGGMQLFGQNEWGVRLPQVIAFCLTVLAVAAIGTAFSGKLAGFLAGLIFLSSFFPVLGAFSLSTDMFLTLWETLAVLCYVKAWKRESSTLSQKWIYSMWFFFGLGFITKGPVALLPLLSIVVHRFFLKIPIRIFNLLGFLIFSIVACWWYVAVEIKHPGLLIHLFKNEVLLRVATDHSGRNAAWYYPFILYLPALILGQGLWLYYFIVMIKKEKLFHFKEIKESFFRRPHASFLLLWFWISFIIFCISKSRLMPYVLPIFVPLVVATAIHMDKIVKNRHIFKMAYLSILIIVMVKGIVSYYPSNKDMKLPWKIIQKHYQPGSYVYSCEETKLFGLQFYLKGKLKRISTLEHSWVDAPMSHVLEEVQNKKRSFPLMIVCKRKYIYLMSNWLSRMKIDFSIEENKYWQVFIIKKVSA